MRRNIDLYSSVTQPGDMIHCSKALSLTSRTNRAETGQVVRLLIAFNLTSPRYTNPPHPLNVASSLTGIYQFPATLSANPSKPHIVLDFPFRYVPAPCRALATTVPVPTNTNGAPILLRIAPQFSPSPGHPRGRSCPVLSQAIGQRLPKLGDLGSCYWAPPGLYFRQQPLSIGGRSTEINPPRLAPYPMRNLIHD
ncbi:hypothetical protein FLAG1_00117 [Fusarium langsethiae]|uniref:Uncharacterized protein n=1 Tax=Fusarium langsethiae TaxID=179993 RepID=A0A0M9F6B2_FUSLA|nr:hypothetical protein FLAG1_00117 [Fusarium langsethiae]